MSQPQIPGYRVERFDPDRDLDGYIAVDQASFVNPGSRESIAWEARHSTVLRSFVLRTDDGQIVGLCAAWLVFDELHINSLAVLPGWRRQGLASFLLHEVIARARREGAQRATLEVRESNVPARRLYERFGFRQVAVRRRYYTNPVEDAIILWIELPADPAGG